MGKRFAGKDVLVTGGNSGLGYGAAKCFAEQAPPCSLPVAVRDSSMRQKQSSVTQSRPCNATSPSTLI